MFIKGMILEFGEVPPGGGAARTEYLRAHGIEALDEGHAYMRSAHDRSNSLSPQIIRIPPWNPAVFGVDSEFDAIRFRNAHTKEEAVTLGAQAAAAERAAVRALNFLEDEPDLVDDSHQLLHEAAAMRSALIGCPLILDEDGTTWVDCPSRISHTRVGQSVGMTTRCVCSVCDTPIEDCAHFPGKIYPLEASLSSSGECNICAGYSCDHEIGRLYEITAQPILKDALLHEVSLVSRPRYPQARITAFGLNFDADSDEYRGAATGTFHCTFCSEPCRGLIPMSTDPGWLLESLLWGNKK
jgi:hypothetical protein